MIEVKASAEKGLGIFAVTDIPRGTRTIAELALLKIDRTNGGARNIRAIECLSPPQQDIYLQLHKIACDAFRRSAEQELGQSWLKIPKLECNVLSVFAANGFGDVFLLGSRSNHSCIPKIHFAYDNNLEMETFHAIRDIRAGEELTMSYINGFNRTRSQRQADLDKWGFVCTCPACTTTTEGDKREEKRAELLKLYQAPAVCLQIKSWKQALKLAQKLAAIQKSEGLLSRELSVS
jgi:hypothetical protein